MAAGGRDIQVFSSDDEVIHPVEKRKRKRKAILSSEDDDEDSNFEVRPRRAARPLNCESDEDDSVNLFNNESENHSTEVRMCSENHESSSSTNDMSDNEQADKCAICLNKFWGQDIATPETCDHMFCLECLLEWAKNVNTCPIDRLRFNLILIRHHKEEKIIKRIFINNPELPRFTEFEWEFNPQTQHVSCELCGEQESDSLTLLVCQECHLSYHSECLIPPMHSPIDSWLCPSCANYVQVRDKFLHDVHRVLRGIKQRFRDLRSLNSGSRSFSSSNPSVRTSIQHSQNRDLWNLRQRTIFARRRVLSSSDSSEEEVEHTSSHAASRLFQTNASSALKARYSVLDGRRREICCSRNPTLVSSTASATANSSLYSYDSDDDINDYSYQNDGNVLSRSGISRRQATIKRFSAPDQVSNSRLSDAGPENFDLVGSILQSQTLLHRPDVLTLKRDGSLLCSKKENVSTNSPSSSSSMESIGHNQNPLQISSLFSDNTLPPYTDDVSGQQRPLNPTQNNAVKYSGTPRQNYSCSSTTSSVERSPSYDASISTKSAHGGHDNEQYNNENGSPMAHKNFCSSSTPEIKKTISPNLKDSAKSQHSEEEVDIYSDIESVGDEEGEVNEREPMKISYKCEELPLTNAGDGTDSSDNELVIDESTPVEDENEGHKAPLSALNSKNSFSENKLSIAQSDESNVSSTALSDQDQLVTDNSNQYPSCSFVDSGRVKKHHIVDKISEDGILNKEVASKSEKNAHSDHNAQNSDIDVQQDENSEDAAGNIHSASSSPKQLIHDFKTVSLETYSNVSGEKEENLENGILNGNESTMDSLSQPEGNEKCTTESNSLLSCESDVQNNEVSESEDIQNMDVSEPEDIENEVTSEPEDTQNADESEPEDARDADVSESEDILNADASGPEDTQNAEMSEPEDTQNTARNESEYPQNDTDGSEPEDAQNTNTSEPEDVQHANESEPEDLQNESESEDVQNASISEPEDVQNNGSEPEDTHNVNASNLEANPCIETNKCQVVRKTSDETNGLQVTNHKAETSSSEVSRSDCVKKSSNTSNDENVHNPEVNLKDAKNSDLIDICNDISMKSDGPDEDDLENAGTPCLDENFEGQIENSPICNENSGSLCESEDQKNNEHIYEAGMLSVVQDTGSTKEKFKPVQIEHKETLNTEKEMLEPSDDLGVEDISEAGSEDLDNDFPDEHENMESHESDFKEQKRERTHAYRKSHAAYEDEHGNKRSRLTSSDRYPSTSHSNHSLEDHEEGEIIEERPPRRSDKKRSSKVARYREQSEEYRERTPKISISDLPRIPKIKRDREKNSVPEEIPVESKRTSVLGRVDLGGDISWKRLSKHTRERSYRDGRPKDERLLFRERESSRNKDKKNGDNEWRNGSKNRESERRRDDKKSENEKPKCEHVSRSRKSEKSKDKSMDWNYSDREKRKSHKDKHSKDKHKEKKEKHEKKHSKSEDKYEREKTKDDSRYERELRYEKEEHFERIVYEKGKFKEKEHKNKHKDRKSDGKPNKEHSREKHKHTHNNEYFLENKREREVRKIDDKLKIVVEQKERKDKSSKHKDKKEAKHEKKLIHHHEHRKKEIERSPYTELTSIESKEIFAKGDSIIINVNFNRACSPKEPACIDNSGSSLKDWKSVSDEFDAEDQVSVDENKSKLSLEKGKNSCDTSVSKRPATPPERNTQVMSVSESYWQGGEDSDVNNSPLSEKSAEEVVAEEDNETVESVDVYEAENFSDSSASVEVLETQVSSKDGADETEEVSECPDKNSDKSFTKENDNFSSKRRSPRSPSPPSPADNDSYDPCEPTRSPSPPPMPPAPPLPAAAPKPPPSPELPPLPPDPEPIDAVREDPRPHKQCSSSDFISSSTVVPSSSQPTTVLSQTSIANSLSMPSMLLPPPTFLTHASSTTNTLPTISPLIPPRNFSFQLNNHGAILFPPNHVQQNIQNSFVPTQMHTGTSLPPPPNPPSLPHMGSVPPPPPPPSAMALMSQVRHPQINVQPTLPPSSLLQSITLGHTVNMAQMQLTQLHHLTPSLHSSLSNHQSSMMMPTVSQPGSLPVSIQQTQQGARLVIAQNQIPNHAANVQNQNNNNSQIHPSNSLSLHSQTISNNVQQKPEKVSKHSPPSEKTEVVDMEVDSPYSPGDSPSMDSVGDYSPTSSPLPSSPKNKDAFDTLLPSDQWTFEKQTQDGRGEKSKRSGSKHDTPSKRMKREHKESGKVRHSIRLQVTEKMKSSRKEQKLSEKKETLSKLDDSQLKILDELPSSAVEMQVKEKYLKKLNRQERVVEEVKLALKPYYKSRDVSKDEYKDILRKSVPKICHNKSGEINPVKVKSLVESYVKKVKHSRKKAEKRKSSKFS